MAFSMSFFGEGNVATAEGLEGLDDGCTFIVSSSHNVVFPFGRNLPNGSIPSLFKSFLCSGNVALSLDDWSPFWPFSSKVSSRLFFTLKMLEIEKERAKKRQLSELKQFKDEKELEDDEDATVRATLPQRGTDEGTPVRATLPKRETDGVLPLGKHLHNGKPIMGSLKK